MLKETQNDMIKSFELKLNSRDTAISTLERTTELQSSTIQKLREEIELKDTMIEKLQQREINSARDVRQLQKELDRKSKYVNNLKEKLEENSVIIKNNTAEIDQLKCKQGKRLDEIDTERSKLNKLVKLLYLRLNVKDRKVQCIVSAYDDKRKSICSLARDLRSIENDLLVRVEKDCAKTVTSSKSELGKLQKKVERHRQSVALENEKKPFDELRATFTLTNKSNHVKEKAISQNAVSSKTHGIHNNFNPTIFEKHDNELTNNDLTKFVGTKEILNSRRINVF